MAQPTGNQLRAPAKAKKSSGIDPRNVRLVFQMGLHGAQIGDLRLRLGWTRRHLAQRAVGLETELTW